MFCGFDAGGMPFGVILVGALNVGSMATVWHGDVTPRKHREVTALPVDRRARAAALAKGDEMARFNMGSTVILLFPPGAAEWDGRSRRAVRCAWANASARCAAGNGADDELTPSWRPTATLARCAGAPRRCATTREFFAARKVLEVETPALVNAPVSDVNLGSVRVEMPGSDAPLFLHTSPEYAMKRLLAAGSGDIYQVCHVYRGAERGRQHNPEFTMLEWYRLGFSLEDLMREVADLVRELLGAASCRSSS